MRHLTGALALAVALHSATATAKPKPSQKRFAGDAFTFPLPAGYDDISATLRKVGLPSGAKPAVGTVALAAKALRRNYRPTIVIQRANIPGGTMVMADPGSACFMTGASMATGVNAWIGPAVTSNLNGTLKSALIVDGPVGKTCQIHFVAPEAVVLITELNRLDGSETWLMTCNHADGDAVSERICRDTLAGFRFRQ